MDNRIVLITIVGLITLNLSCTNNSGEKQKQLISEVDSETLKDSIEDTDTSYLSIYKKELEDVSLEQPFTLTSAIFFKLS